MNAPREPQYLPNVRRHVAADRAAVERATAHGNEVDRPFRVAKLSRQLGNDWRNTSPEWPGQAALVSVVTVAVDGMNDASSGLEPAGEGMGETTTFDLEADEDYVPSSVLRRLAGDEPLPSGR
jgi:hypothetical protein